MAWSLYRCPAHAQGQACRICKLEGTIKSDLLSRTRVRTYYRREDLLEEQENTGDSSDGEEESGEERDEAERGHLHARNPEINEELHELERLAGWDRQLDRPLVSAIRPVEDRVSIHI